MEIKAMYCVPVVVAIDVRVPRLTYVSHLLDAAVDSRH